MYNSLKGSGKTAINRSNLLFIQLRGNVVFSFHRTRTIGGGFVLLYEAVVADKLVDFSDFNKKQAVPLT